MTYIYVIKLIIICSDNGLLPGQRQAIIWTNAGIWYKLNQKNKIQRNFQRNSYIFIQNNAFENICEMASVLSRPQCIKQKTKFTMEQLYMLPIPYR